MYWSLGFHLHPDYHSLDRSYQGCHSPQRSQFGKWVIVHSTIIIKCKEQKNPNENALVSVNLFWRHTVYFIHDTALRWFSLYMISEWMLQTAHHTGGRNARGKWKLNNGINKRLKQLSCHLNDRKGWDDIQFYWIPSFKRHFKLNMDIKPGTTQAGLDPAGDTPDHWTRHNTLFTTTGADFSFWQSDRSTDWSVSLHNTEQLDPDTETWLIRFSH